MFHSNLVHHLFYEEHLHSATSEGGNMSIAFIPNTIKCTLEGCQFYMTKNVTWYALQLQTNVITMETA